ncbi:unnamed protein product [Mycena citricolor]|uniref:Uncharacterized protein n=1 Tax=Mycena citricolor TaxID=2018698 RepID=A0AAD2JW58_9AGAR|nr:unnamed protein product [Mycena citricolor]
MLDNDPETSALRTTPQNTLTHLAQNFRVPENDHTVLGTSQSDIQPPGIVQESDALVLVTANTAEDDVVLLPALERIHTRDLDLLVQILLERPVELHVVHDIRPLAFVRRHHANLARHDTRFEELGHDLLHIRRLRPVQKRRPAARDFLLAQVLVEEHRRVGNRPREIDVLAQSFGGRDAVLQSPFVEHVRRELGQTRMHPILHLQADRSIAEHH